MNISEKKQTKFNLSEEEIDQIVVAQADDNSAWSEPIQVRKTKPTDLSIPGELAARAAFLAQLHREKNMEEWITRIIRERIELEEAAFLEIKRDLAIKSSESNPRLT